jgi:glycerol 3-phosphatase-1
LAAKDCVVVEDAPAGIRAGRAADSRVLALRTTEADDLLKAAGATWIVNDLSRVTLGPVAKGQPLRLSLQM